MRFLLNHLLERSATDRPDGVAVVDRDRSITYSELDRRAVQLANLLAEAGVVRGDRVALYLDKTIESILAIYGVLKIGAVYVPLDPSAPTARLGYIVGNCGVRVFVSGQNKSASWQGLLDAGAVVETVIVLDADAADVETEADLRVLGRDDVDRQSIGRAPAGNIDLDLAYILYTSGSTGSPKGVMLSHRNALTFVEWVVDRFSVGPDDRLSSHAPLHFDLSILDVFAASLAGATLVLVPAKTSVFPVEVVRFIERYGITIWYSVPSILSMVVLRGGLTGGEMPTLRIMFFAGEVFPTKYLSQLMTLLPHVEFHNLYGPTETNVCTHYHVSAIPSDLVRPIPIGSAIAGVEAFAVTEDDKLAERGEVGELYVRGTTVMTGYWGDEERTTKMLVDNPVGGDVNDRMYRTGDLVREDDDGNFEFLGRRDAQIKSRGYRIELGEIEVALYAHDNVSECAVVAVPDDLVTNRLKAYVALKQETDVKELARSCALRVPHYMVPESFEIRDGLPKTSTGKIDRQALMREALEQS